MSEVKEIILDGDNTVYTWVAYAAKAYPAMAKVIADETGIQKDSVEAAMRTYYEMAGSMDSSSLIEGLVHIGFMKRARKEVDYSRLRYLVKGRFDHYRDKYFKTYPGMADFVKFAHERGVKVRLLTDAPVYHAIPRAEKSGIIQHLTSIHAVKITEIVGELSPTALEAKEKRERTDYGCHIEELEVEKPDTRLEQVVLAAANDEIKSNNIGQIRDYIRKYVCIVDDNFEKLKGLCKKYGCQGFHVANSVSDADVKALAPFAPDDIANRNVPAEGRARRSGHITTVNCSPQLGEDLKKAIFNGSATRDRFSPRPRPRPF